MTISQNSGPILGETGPHAKNPAVQGLRYKTVVKYMGGTPYIITLCFVASPWYSRIFRMGAGFS